MCLSGTVTAARNAAEPENSNAITLLRLNASRAKMPTTRTGFKHCAGAATLRKLPARISGSCQWKSRLGGIFCMDDAVKAGNFGILEIPKIQTLRLKVFPDATDAGNRAGKPLGF